MSIHMLKDGRWVCDYNITSGDRRKQKREYFGRGPEGEYKANKRNDELIAQGIIRPYKKYTDTQQHGHTFGELALEYVRIHGKTNMQPSSLDRLQACLAGTILPAIGHLKAAGLTHSRLDQYVETRLDTPKTVNRGTTTNPEWVRIRDKKGKIQYISRSSVHRELCDIQAILNWAVSKQLLLANPVIGHKKPKKEKKKLKPPTPEETIKILEHATPHLIRALEISYFIGLRPGASELFSMTWDAVDFEKGTIYVDSAEKGGLPYRIVPIADELMADLQEWYAEDRENSAPEIITYNGKPVKSVKKAFQGAKRRAGITREIRMYDFRHAFATDLLRAGGDLKSVSEMLGHSRIDTTVEVYQHTDLIMHQQQIKKRPRLKKQNQENEENILDFNKLKTRKK